MQEAQRSSFSFSDAQPKHEFLAYQIKWSEKWERCEWHWWERRPAGCLLTFHSCEHKSISKHYLVLCKAATPQFEGIDCPVWSHTSTICAEGLGKTSVPCCFEWLSWVTGSNCWQPCSFLLGASSWGPWRRHCKTWPGAGRPPSEMKKGQKQRPLASMGTVRPQAWVGPLLLVRAHLGTWKH